MESDAAIPMRDADFDDALWLGDPASADLLQRARALAGDPAGLVALTEEVDSGPWHGVPWGDAARVAYVREHRDEFLL